MCPNVSFPSSGSHRYIHLDVGRNKAIEARSARWRFRRVREVFAGNADSRYRSNPLIPAYISDRNGFSAQNLWLMQQFYREYSDSSKLQPLVREISWTKNLVILARCKDELEREFYLRATAKFGWTKSVCLVPKLWLGNAYRQALLEEVFYRSVPVIRDAKASCTAFPSWRLGTRQERLPEESAPIGIIICRSKNKTVVEYALRNAVRPLGVATYAVVPQLPYDYKAELPSPELIAERLRLWDKIDDEDKGANHA